MRRSGWTLVGMTALLAVGVACSRAPFTHRIQYNLVPDPLMRSIGAMTYGQMLGDAQVATGTDNAKTLKQVGRRISRAADEPKYDWEYTLIRADDINAWCLPGGKIGFYNGILPVLENEAGMAFVMGHEVGHATAHHGAERISQQLTLIGGLAGLEIYLSNKSQLSPEQRALIVGALGVGAQFGVMLPFSRAHESEADIIGMMYMSKAGYPPIEAIHVWDRMEAQAGSGVPAFLSTHPSNKKRKENLREWLPQARKRYKRNAIDRDTREARWGRSAN